MDSTNLGSFAGGIPDLSTSTIKYPYLALGCTPVSGLNSIDLVHFLAQECSLGLD